MAHYSQGWPYRASVTVTPPTISAALTGYVALVRLTAANFDFSKALATGYDVRFGILGGTAFLPFERVLWDAEGETALFYVRIPSLPVAGTTLYVYAGNSEATDASSGANTWTDYAAVVHLIRDGDGKIYESKSGSELTLVGGVAYPASVDGLNGKAEQFDGDAEAGYWVMPAALLPNFGSTFTQDLSLEVVAKAASTDSVDHPIVSQGDYTNTTYSLYLERYAGNIFLNDGPAVALAADAWAAITGSRDLSESIRALDVNGGSDTDSGVTNDPVDASVFIGGNAAVTTGGSERAFKGVIEEVRFVYAVRSDDWHKVFQADLIDGTLLTVESMELNPDSGIPHFAEGWFRLYRIQIEAETASEGPCVVVGHWLRNGTLANDSHTLGYDIRFATGLEFIPYERQIYVHSPVVEQQFAIRVPKLNQGTNYVYLYTTNPLTTDGSDTEATWADDVQAKADVTVEVDWTFWNLKNPVMKHAYPHFSLGYSHLTPLKIVPIEPGSETLTDVVVKFTVDGDDLEAYHDRGTLTGCMYGKFHMVRFGDPDGEGWFASSPSGRSLAYDSFKDPITFYVQIPSLPPEGTVLWMYFGVPTSSIYTVYYAANAQPAQEGAIEVSAVFPDPWRIANPDGAPPMLVGAAGPTAAAPSSPEEALPDDPPSSPAVTAINTKTILSAQIHYEDYGIAVADITATTGCNVGSYVEIFDPVTTARIFRGIATRSSYDYKSRVYSVQLQDPMSALSQGAVIWSSPHPETVANVLWGTLAEFGQVLTIGDTNGLTDVQFPPNGFIWDTDGEVEITPLDWVDLTKTICRLLDCQLAFTPDCQYQLGRGSVYDHGLLTDSQILGAIKSTLIERYANRVIVKCSGEWWSDQIEASTAVETIRGASMTVKRYGEQVREITLDSGGVYHHEVMTYDASSRMTQHVATVITTVPSGTQYKTETTRVWTITDEADYTYTETTITQIMGYWEEEWRNLNKREVTTVVSDGSVEETAKGYGWNYDLSDWNPLITNDSMTILRGFPAQPGINGYGVKETYRYVYDSDRSEWIYDQVKAEAVNSAPSAPGFTVVLPLSKTTVNYCVTADDEAAQTALGLKEAEYSPLCLKDEASMPALSVLAENTLKWHSRCRQMVCEVPLTLAETWVVGDTFTWDTLVWTIEKLDHDLQARTTQVTATAPASIEYLRKSLMPEYDEAGRAIVGIARKQAEKVDNVQPATIVSQVDYETWVVKLANGRIKLAKLQYGSDALLAPGSSVMLMRGSML